MKNTLVVVLGPTGVGKTGVAIEIARRFGTGIISADSRQFYKDMMIGTAVPDESQLRQVKHHFVRFLPVDKYYSASLFERDVLDLLPAFFRNSGLAVMAGGSGMYIDAVCNGIDDIPDIEPAIREKFNRKFREEGIESLRIDLKVLDPEYYSRVDLKNHKRIIRALEICETTGRPYSAFLAKSRPSRDFAVIKIGLEMDRDKLYERLDKRVDEMIRNGLEEEARKLSEFRELNALKSVGYTELFSYFDGKISREKAIELIKRNTRRYAKRQITWWRKDTAIKWFNPDNIDGIINYLSFTCL